MPAPKKGPRLPDFVAKTPGLACLPVLYAEQKLL
jgi:hypothetical protein